MEVAADAAATASIAASQAGEGASEPKENGQAKDGAPDFKGTKHRLKVDSVEEEVDYDDLISDAQKGRSSTRRFQKAAEIEKRVDAFFGALTTGDKEVLNELREAVPRDKLKEWAEEFLIDAYEEEDLPKEERDRRKLAKENEELKGKLSKVEEAEVKAKWNREVQAAGDEVQGYLDEFFETTGAERNPVITARVLEFMLAEEEAADKAGRKPDMKKAHTRAIKTLELDGMRYMNGRKPEDFVKQAPPQFVKALREFFIAEAQGARRYSDDDDSEGDDLGSATPRKERPKLGIDEWFKSKEQKLKRR